MKYIFVLFLYLVPVLCSAQDFYKLLYEEESKTRTGDLKASLALYNQATAIGTLSPESLYNLSCLYGKADDTINAQKYFTKAVDAGFGNPDYIKMEPAPDYQWR